MEPLAGLKVVELAGLVLQLIISHGFDSIPAGGGIDVFGLVGRASGMGSKRGLGELPVCATFCATGPRRNRRSRVNFLFLFNFNS
jgi:hypothetical protein